MADEEIKVKATPINKLEIKGAIAFSAENARIWAEGTDEEVEKLGGEHSAKGWAGEAREEGKQYTDEQIAQAREEITEQINTNSLNVLQQAYGYTDNAISAEAAIREAQAESYVKKNESPTLDAGGSYAFNFAVDSQNLRIMASDSGLEFENRTAGSAIRMGSNGDISLEPSAGKVVFSDGNPVITTKDKATTSALGVVKVDGETISANNGVISVTPEDWQKPADLVDIRSGALNNSIYVLVGHAADYSQYAKFSFIANTSTSGNTYDVYVDGIKQTTTASGTATTLDWQTLALDSGYDVTYPATLRTHIVRITPTQSTDTLTRYRIYAISGQRDQGLLWLHFELSNPIQIASLCATDTSVRNFLLQAVTAKNDNITYTVNSNSVNSGFYGAFRSCTSLKKIPVLTAESTQYASGTYISFIDVPLKKVIIKNNSGREELRLINSAKIQEFDIENGVILSSSSSGITDAHGAVNLKKLPPINASDAATFQANGLTSLQDTVIDDSSNSSRKLFRFYGTGAEPVRGLKGLVVSNEAPFDGESPQINVAYTGLDRQALRQLFKSMPTVSANQVCNITGATGAADLTAEDLAIATTKGWTVTR